MAETAVSLDEFKAHLNLPANTKADPTELQLHLDAATEAIEARIGPVITRSYTERLRSRNGTITVEHAPLVAVTSLTQTPGGLTWDVTLLDVDRSGVITLLEGSHLPYAQFDVTYTAGRGDTAASRHKLAIMITAEQLWQSQRGNGVRPAMFGMAPEGAATSAHEADYIYRGFAFPKRALELIAGDEQIAFA